MRIPVMTGVIDRRILVNYRVDPTVMATYLPKPFQPQLVNGYGVAGVCLIRLKEVRPKCVLVPVGISSENAAHRFAVQWEEEGQLKTGVYIPRRDTDSLLNHLAGGTVFPGIHHRAEFEVKEENEEYLVALLSADGETTMRIAGHTAEQLPDTSIFSDIQEASKFFEGGCLGFSPSSEAGKFDGLELRTQQWSVKPLRVTEAHSSYFSSFPDGSLELDHALLMHDIEHEWHDRGELTDR